MSMEAPSQGTESVDKSQEQAEQVADFIRNKAKEANSPDEVYAALTGAIAGAEMIGMDQPAYYDRTFNTIMPLSEKTIDMAKNLYANYLNDNSMLANDLAEDLPASISEKLFEFAQAAKETAE